MSRIDALEARRQALLNKCEEQRLELSYRVAQITPRNALTAWTRSRRAGGKGGISEPAALDCGRRRTVDDVVAPAATEVSRRRCRPRCRIDYDGVGVDDAGNDGFADIGAATCAVYDLQGDAPTRAAERARRAPSCSAACPDATDAIRGWARVGVAAGEFDVGFGTAVAVGGEVPAPVPGAYTGANVFVSGSDGAAAVELAVLASALPVAAAWPTPAEPGALAGTVAPPRGGPAPTPAEVGAFAGAVAEAVPVGAGEAADVPTAPAEDADAATPAAPDTPFGDPGGVFGGGAAPLGASGPGLKSACNPTTAGIPFAACSVSRARSQ